MMKEFDDYGLKLCQYQGELFSMSKEKLECSSPIFLRRFMYSNVAKRMDGEGFLYEAISQSDVIDEINEEFGESSYGQIKYEIEELYWIGYIYRYWSYAYKISSKRLYKMIKPEELKKLYYPYHSLDPALAIERMMEAHKLEEEDYIKKGVKIMRRLMKENGSKSS